MELFFDDNMQSLKNKIINYVSTSADIWSGRRRSFMGVTVHWIEELSLERRSAAIACRRFKSFHTADRIAELLHTIHDEFDLYHAKIRELQ